MRDDVRPALRRASVCVFCGSRPGADPRYVDVARAMGEAVALRGLTLVYGGGRVGLMGALADAAIAAGGRVVGVIPRSMVDREVAHRGLAELHVTESMHARKETMIALSDAFVALPGGFGTYDELFETITLGQIGMLGAGGKPNALLDVFGFFAPLVALLEHTVATGFAVTEHVASIVVASEPGALLDRIEAWEAP